MQNDNSKRIITVAVIFAIGTVVSVAGSYSGVVYNGIPVFLLCGFIAFLLNWVAFVPSCLAQTEKYYDLVGSTTYISIIATAFLLSGDLSFRAQLAALMVVVWAVRLGTFLFRRISQDGHDDRFDEIKINPLRFFIAWNIQALWALLTAACALVIITSSNQKPIEWFGYFGLIIWALGFVIEILADSQKRLFKLNPENKGRFINVGLWSWCRHPNYFGEITLWLGMAIFALPVLNGWQYLTLISPIFVFLLLTRVSGIPLLSKKGLEKWGEEPEYQSYLKNTSLLIPLPPKK